jgi:hypothetical protein
MIRIELFVPIKIFGMCTPQQPEKKLKKLHDMVAPADWGWAIRRR